jgi:Lon protease-like protein
MAPYKPPARDVARALAELPIVVVRQVVLFPGVRLSLATCEPRQVAAVRVALGGHRTLGVVQPKRVEVDDGRGASAAISSVGAVGTIVDHVEVGSGRFELVLLGRARVGLRELKGAGSYRLAEATVLPSLDSSVSPAELTALHRAAARFRALLGGGAPPIDLSPAAEGDPGALSDAYAHALVPDARQRQTILEALDVRQRVLLVAEILTTQCCMLQDDPAPNN